TGPPTGPPRPPPSAAAREAGRAEDEIQVRRPLLDALLLELRHAAHDADEEPGALFLEAPERAELRVHLVLCLLTDGAGVDEDEVRLVGGVGELVALVFEEPRHPLGGVLV